MARNFDEELPDDLTFTVAGETFTMILVGPQVLAEFEDAEPVKTAVEAISRSRAQTTAFLQEGDRARWNTLLDDDKVPYRQVEALVKWMVETQTGRPTAAPSPSESGPGATARSSRGRSS